MEYDRDRLRRRLAEVLAEVIPAGTLAIGRAAVIDHVTESALDALKFICGNPGASTPRGLLSSPSVFGQDQ